MKELWLIGVKCHELALKGDKEATKKAYESFKEIHKLDPKNNLAEAYLGSATSLLGRDSIDPNLKLKLVLQGLKTLDSVVLKEKENIQIRSLRAYVGFNLPEMFFHRTASAVEDFKYLLARYEQDKGVFTEKFYWQILCDLGVAYKRLGRKNEAIAIWDKLLQVTSDPKYKDLIKK
ncbi:hypothetical protein [Desulfosporosinus sp. Sb-LF]|uniref:tetratricopeptide repeat protein n=1 Tax=Desulfosporosinus sp. Sb-LF TaxID=2560027 RepID=UPI00107EF284|nr:hypothetical protein [Desulfosporosinus sp. Sb-LF]TGE32136.1 hypothetical protein E4K68_13530 [Desulfosporosinus sp. Sb-LF]